MAKETTHVKDPPRKTSDKTPDQDLVKFQLNFCFLTMLPVCLEYVQGYVHTELLYLWYQSLDPRECLQFNTNVIDKILGLRFIAILILPCRSAYISAYTASVKTRNVL